MDNKLKITIDKKTLQEYLKERMTDGNWPHPADKNVPTPAVITEPAMEEDPVAISPATETQVSEPNMPIGDIEWSPGNNNELQKASGQLVQQVPEGHREWFWGRLKNLVDKTLEASETSGEVLGIRDETETQDEEIL